MLSKVELRESRLYVVFLACMVAVGPLSMDVYLPSLQVIADHFKADIAAVNLTISSFMIGSAIGQFLGGAMSDQLGRKTIGLTGVGIFLVSTLLILFAENIQTVQFLRVTQALGSGFASVVCLAQIRDLYPKEEVMKRFANVMFIMFLAPLLAPFLGATLVQFGWHYIFLFLIGWGSIIFVIYIFCIPETVIDKADRFTFPELFTGYLRVLTHRVDGRITASRYILFAGFSSSIFMTFLTNSGMIYMQYFEVSSYQFAFIFSAHGLMLMLGNRVAVKLASSRPGLKVLRGLNLLQLILTTLLFSITLLGLYSLGVILVFTLIIMAFNGAINPTTSGLFITYFDKNAGAAASLNTTTVFIFGGVIGGLAALLANGELLPIFMLMMLASMIARCVLLTIRENH